MAKPCLVILASVVLYVWASLAYLSEQVTFLDKETLAALVAATTHARASAGDEGARGGDLQVYVGFLSAPGNGAKRRHLRETCLPRAREACRRYAAEFIAARDGESTGNNGENDDDDDDDAVWRRACEIKFFVGQPSDPERRSTGHGQGVIATPLEIEVANALTNETRQFTDLQVIPMRDSYHDLPSKTLTILRRGALSGAKVVLKIDDDMCPNMDKVLRVANTTQPDEARYVGQYMWKGDEYPTMKGADGQHFPYMSGPAYLLSAALAQAVAVDEENVSALHMPYGSSSEDVDMGRWYNHTQTTHPHLKFRREVVRGLAASVPKVKTNTTTKKGR